MSENLTCPECGHTLFVAYRIIRHQALISQTGNLTLIEGDEPGAIDEILCDRCDTHLWDGTVLGYIEADQEGGYALPAEVYAGKVA
ncbi:hypothetical protein [Geoalkalibacter halelectricus]|uniref:hypothetical protein n=1 Tax=Geoalkalibacter halelectricus TaxID=2847045 RepID=UPI003D1948FF